MDTMPGITTATTIVPTTFHPGITAQGSWHTHSSTLHTILTHTIRSTITTITVDTATTVDMVLMRVQADMAVPGIRATPGEDLSEEYLTTRVTGPLEIVVAMHHHPAAVMQFLDVLVPVHQVPRLAIQTGPQDQAP
jgi:hypothetical protein